jgi:hypothetical protein
LQRWISPDPLEIHGGGSGDLNVYAYVSGQALKATDPLGLETDQVSSFEPKVQNRDGTVGEGSATGAPDRDIRTNASYAPPPTEVKERDPTKTSSGEDWASAYQANQRQNKRETEQARTTAATEDAKWAQKKAEWDAKPPLWKLLHSVGLGSLDTPENMRALEFAAGLLGRGGKAGGGGKGFVTPPKGGKAPAQAAGGTRAAAERAKNTARGIPESQIGPSGKPKIHVKEHATRKRAEDAAQDRSRRGTAPEEHSNPTKGDPHFHPSGSNSREHHAYPRKGSPRNEEY